MKFVRLVFPVAFAGALTSCGHDLDGPTPAQNGQEDAVDPQAVCVEQITTPVVLRGRGFSPMPIKTMEEQPMLALPKVELVLSKDLTGAAGSGAVTVVADDPAAPDKSQVHWYSQEQMLFRVYPELKLPVGLHTIRLTNANRHAGEWADALLAVPRPRLESITPDVICADQPAELALVGTFIKRGAVYPKVTAKLGAEGTPVELPVSEMRKCRALPGGAGLEECAEMIVLVASGKLVSSEPYDNYTVTVTNPSPVGCHSEDNAVLTVVPPPAVKEITPDITCPTGNGKEITITGTGFLVFDGQNPSVTVAETSLQPTPSNCTAVVGPRATVQLCTTMTVMIPTSIAKGLKQLEVTNPAPAGCVSTEVPLYISPPPTLTRLAPSAACSSADSSVVVVGNDFLVIGGTVPTLVVDTAPFAATASGCLPVPGLRETLDVCSSLVSNVAKDTLTQDTHQVSVANPSPADCAASTPLPLEMVLPPTVTTVTPSQICVGGGTLTIMGESFRAGITTVVLRDTVPTVPKDYPATTVTVIDAQHLTAAFSSGKLPPARPEGYDVIVSNAKGCDATLIPKVQITDGPQLFFADPPVVYSGISTQITLYGSGFTGTVQGVSMRLAGSTATPTALTVNWDAARPNRALVVIPKDTPAGTYDLLLRDQTACEATLLGALAVVSEETLALTAITPSFGYTGGSTAVTINADRSVAGGLQAVPRLYLSSTAADTSATPLGSVAFLDAGTVTGVVPKSLPAGTYDLIAVNPDGGVSVLDAAFQVNPLAPPVLTSISPGSIPTQAGQTVTVTGQNFRAPSALLRCLNAGTGQVVENTPIVSTSTGTEATLAVNASTLIDGMVCVVRITNDDQAFGELSALVVTNPAANLWAFSTGKPLNVARRALVTLSNQATSAARYIYAIGGDNGTAANALSSVESAPVDVFGRASDFFVQPYSLGTARSYAGAATVGRCLYVVGGFDGTQPLDTVERACVLDPQNRPEIMDLDLAAVTTGGLANGLWYYQVSAVMSETDPSNPDGETLPSEPFPLLLPTLSGRKVNVTLHWTAVSGAVEYRIYRSPSADTGSKALTRIATVSATSATPTQYTDVGATASAERPLPLGSTGKWHPAGTLTTVRQGAGVAIAPDPADATGTKFYLYAIGGKNASAALASYDSMSITINGDGSQTVGPCTAGSETLEAARWQLAAYSVGKQEAPNVGAAHYIYAASGIASNGAAVSDVEAFLVGASGVLGAPVSVSAMSPARAGYGSAAANNFLYAFGGQGATPSATVKQAKISVAPTLDNWNNATSLQVPRYLMGSTMQSGFIYLLGGQTSTEAATKSTEYTIW